jgi:acyl-CoA reductase-like NAD-dependent aldehyde dehydrogenase
VNFPARAELVPEPLGAVLIIGTWNYPFHSSLGPLAGAIAAGNVVLVKPGSLARNSSKLMSELIRKNFDSNAIVCLEGGKEILQPILDMKWDHIMFTGSPQMGRIVMGAAAKHLTGVTLELGGKSPVIVSETADIALAARRVCWSKFASNAGQVCVSCDHMFVHSSVADEFISKLKVMIGEFFPELARSDPNYCRIVTRGHTERLKKIIETDKGHLIIGGESVVDEKFVAPTVIDFQLDWEAFKSSACMQGEIFGPILPIVRYDTIDQIESFIRSQTRTKPPLAFYIFTSESRASVRNRWINQCPAGAVVVNDCGMHIVEEDLPFGGVGNSGLGAYHGRKSFEIFTHYKPVLWKTRWLDIPFRYPPLTRLRQRAVVFLLWLARHRVTPMRIGKSVLLLAILWRIFT